MLKTNENFRIRKELEKLSKEIEDIKNYMKNLELKNTISKTKHSMDELNSKIEESMNLK